MKYRIAWTLIMVFAVLLSFLVGCEPQGSTGPLTQLMRQAELPEIITEIWEFLVEFFGGYPLLFIVLLVFVDLGLAVFAAMLNRKFEADKLADFYVTNVIPYIGGYTILYIAVQIASDRLSEGFLGPYTYLFSTSILAIAWAALLIKLGDSIVKNAKKFGYVKEELEYYQGMDKPT